MAMFRLTGMVCVVLAAVAEANGEADFENGGLLLDDPMFYLMDQLTSDVAERHAGKRSTDSCNSSSRTQSILACGLTSLKYGITMHTLNNYCNNLECNLQCLKDAIGDCYLSDHLFGWEPTATAVHSRLYCEDKALTLSMVHCVRLGSGHCFEEMKYTLKHELVPLLRRKQYTLYRQKYCSFIKKFLTCLNYDRCPSKEAALGMKAYTAGISFRKCGYEQRQSWFQQYGGPPMCHPTASIPAAKLQNQRNPDKPMPKPEFHAQDQIDHSKTSGASVVLRSSMALIASTLLLLFRF